MICTALFEQIVHHRYVSPTHVYVWMCVCVYVFFVQFQQGNDGEMAVDAVLVDDSPPVPDDVNVDEVVLAVGLTQ